MVDETNRDAEIKNLWRVIHNLKSQALILRHALEKIVDMYDAEGFFADDAEKRAAYPLRQIAKVGLDIYRAEHEKTVTRDDARVKETI